MRLTKIVRFLIVLHTVSAAGADSVITTPRAYFSPTDAALREWCGPGEYDACTRFVGYRLDAACSDSGDGVRIIAIGRITALIRLRDGSHLDHEHAHVRNVRESLDRYLHDLESMRYESVTACESAATRAIGTFPEHVRAFARESTLRLHPALRAAHRKSMSGARAKR